MKLLIVVDKLLTGFDAPPATYLYIDKQMRDHGLFQAICRVNRLDGDDKEYGYIVDYKDLFKRLEGAVADYTGGAFDGYDKEDVDGPARRPACRRRASDLEEAREAVRALCEPVGAAEGHGRLPALLLRRRTQATPNSSRTTSRSGSSSTSTPPRCCAPTPTSPTRWPRRVTRRPRATAIKAEVDHYEKVREEVKLAQRRRHRLQAVRAGHAPPDRHLHPRRGQREGLGLRRHVADPADRRARRRMP